jgi:hypothetical protein
MMKRRMHIRRESKTRAAQNRQYRKKVETWAVGKRCVFPGCGSRKADCHHTRGRVGALLLDERFWLPLCRRHHDWVVANPQRARELGLLCQRGHWNVPVQPGKVALGLFKVGEGA